MVGSAPPAMRHLKRALTLVDMDDATPSRTDGVLHHQSDVTMLPAPVPDFTFATASKDAACMDPPLQPPPWKRASLAQQVGLGHASLPVPQSPTRLLTPRISWSDILSQSQDVEEPGAMEPHSPHDSSCWSPRTPRPRIRQPPTPPVRAPCRRRPPSDDEEGCDCDQNEGRFAREFTEVTPIGRGQFSSVVRARNKIDRCLYAVKKTTTISRGTRQAQLREVFALASVAIEAEGCPNIVRYFSSWLEDGRLHIQTELCECSLRDILAQRRRTHPSDPRFAEQDLVQVLRDVANGLVVLHARNFVHLDIKPDNILLSRGSPPGCYKIADLGLAAAAIGSGCDDISEGDCRYLAKEVLRGDLSNLPKADVFSLGLVCYELATNPKALPCNGEEWHALRNGHFEVHLLPLLSAPFYDLLLRMVHLSPAARPPCKEITRHASIACGDELQVLQEQMKQRTLEAERNKQLADEYWHEILSLKRQELLGGGLPSQPMISGRPVASPAVTLSAAPVTRRHNTC